MLDDVIALRADLAEIRADLAAERPSPLGGLPEAKAFEARVYALLREDRQEGLRGQGLGAAAARSSGRA